MMSAKKSTDVSGGPKVQGKDVGDICHGCHNFLELNT